VKIHSLGDFTLVKKESGNLLLAELEPEPEFEPVLGYELMRCSGFIEHIATATVSQYFPDLSSDNFHLWDCH